MGKYMLCNTEQLDADMKRVADTIRSKGGTAAELEWPDGFKTAVEAISTGTKVQIKSGTLRISNNSGSINCWFKPDFISLSAGGSHEGYLVTAGFGFTAHGNDKILTPIMLANYAVILYGERTSSGANFMAYQENKAYSGSLSYIAVKYT